MVSLLVDIKHCSGVFTIDFQLVNAHCLGKNVSINDRFGAKRLWVHG